MCTVCSNDEIVELTAVVAARIRSLLKRRGLGMDGSEEEDMFFRDEPGLAGLYVNSVRSRVAAGLN
jgi:hypothetical protein